MMNFSCVFFVCFLGIILRLISSSRKGARTIEDFSTSLSNGKYYLKTYELKQFPYGKYFKRVICFQISLTFLKLNNKYYYVYSHNISQSHEKEHLKIFLYVSLLNYLNTLQIHRNTFTCIASSVFLKSAKSYIF